MTVVVISTGGTIASTSDDGDDGAAPDLTGSELVDAVPELTTLTDIRVDDFANIPSPHLSLDDMYALTELIREYDMDSAVEGIVVTQGTDVLEESALFVDLCYDGDTPVVFTGAMRPSSTPSADGPGNLLASVRTVLDEQYPEAGVLVVFNDRIYDAQSVTKAHSMNVDSFRSIEVGPLGTLDEDRVRWHRLRPGSHTTFTPSRGSLQRDVWAVMATMDMVPAQIPEPEQASALCLGATGAGHIPPAIIPRLESLRSQGVPIVATTRCPAGRLAADTYNFEGSEATLQRLGCHYSELHLQKTRIKTILSVSVNGLDEAFDRPY